MYVAESRGQTRDPSIFSLTLSQDTRHVSYMYLHLLLCYSSLLWFLLPRSFCASPADPQRELNMRQDTCNALLLLPLWLSINRARLITSIGHGNNVGIKAEEGARMWHIRAAGFSGTDLIQSGSLIWRSLNQSWRGEPFEELFSGAALAWWNGHMDSRRMERHKCLLMAFSLFVMDQSNIERETHGMNRNDGFERSCRFWACFPPGVWYKCKIRDLNCSPGAPLTIMTRCMHKNSR